MPAAWNIRRSASVLLQVVAVALLAGCGGASNTSPGGSNPAAATTPSGGSGDYLSALSKAQQKALAIQSTNNLKIIGLAFHMYHDMNLHFPTGAITKDNKPEGTPVLSWRVALLPFMEEQALYKEFKLDEPWDSPHNKKLLPRMPKVYLDPRFQRKEDKPDVTYYQGFTGDGGVLGAPGGGLSLGIITNANGSSNTLLVVEAGDPVPWTRPADLVHDLKKSVPPLGGPQRQDFYALFVDGHTQRLSAKIDPKILHCAINWQNDIPFTLP